MVRVPGDGGMGVAVGGEAVVQRGHGGVLGSKGVLGQLLPHRVCAGLRVLAATAACRPRDPQGLLALLEEGGPLAGVGGSADADPGVQAGYTVSECMCVCVCVCVCVVCMCACVCVYVCVCGNMHLTTPLCQIVELSCGSIM